MRFVPFALVVVGSLLSASALVGQGKDAKDPKKDPVPATTDVGGKSLDHWIKEIQNSDPSHRQTAIRFIIQIGTPARKAAPALIGRLPPDAEPDAEVRAEAALALGQVGIDKADLAKGVAGLVAALQGDPQPTVRLQAASALGHLGPDAKASIPALSANLDAGTLQVRRACAWASSILIL